MLLVAVTVPLHRAEARYAAIVIDAETGEVLNSADADTRNYPASLTKMMTLYMLFEALEQGRLTLDSKLTASQRAAGMSPSKLGLKPGDTIRVREAILALVTKSANDVAVTVAESLADSEWQFAIKMTERARALGMSRTTFKNASGLPNKGQLSTARDMATLSAALLRDFPQHYHYFSASSFSWQGRTYSNHNNLLGQYRGTDGIKTGYIRASGFNLAASVERNGRRLIAVVFGGRTAKSRDQQMVRLLDRGFSTVTAHSTPVPDTAPAPKPLQLAASEAMTDGTSVNPESTGDGDGLGLVGQAHAALPGGPWAVQVGAFRQAGDARRLAETASRRVPQLVTAGEVSVSQVRGDRGPLYRARIIGLSKDSAQEACRRLEGQSMPCLVIRHDG
jgi:D-alanyl-D-alanine carboxypeptidase